ncbi:peptidoglycan-binding protein [Xanthobacter autotrophicus]|uniref:peptidoglycan-binding domain-containing protein n=1 Tax=Xanthobacter TaxID=279 RepID=UPI0024AB8C7C|nr:peptidoglycan-binding protein [Xanthobacter autotrophicus]MDI4663901.1 peptidoglycan-binding protein [Xanthobacter autotrophicus]
MKLEPVLAGRHGEDAPAEAADLVAEVRAGEERRLRRLDVMAGAVAVVASGVFLVNLLLLQAPPPGAPLPEARPAGAVQALDRAKTGRTTVPLPPHGPGTPAASAGGATNGALGYLSIRTTVTGTPVPLVPATAGSGRSTTEAHADPVPRRPPASVGAGGDVTGAVRPPTDVPASPRILAVQKALAKLGYGPLKVDGRPGGETRTAIQRFQRDRNMAADGEISDRLVRELASVSGVTVN